MTLYAVSERSACKRICTSGISQNQFLDLFFFPIVSVRYAWFLVNSFKAWRRAYETGAVPFWNQNQKGQKVQSCFCAKQKEKEIPNEAGAFELCIRKVHRAAMVRFGMLSPCLAAFRFLNRRKAAFSVRIIEPWNKLPAFVAGLSSVDVFKSRLDACWTEVYPNVI